MQQSGGRLHPEHVAIRSLRLRVAIEREQRVRAMAQEIDRTGLASHRPVEAFDRLRVPSHGAQHEAAIAVRRGESGICRERAIEQRQRLRIALEALQNDGAVGQHGRRLGGDFQGRLDEPESLGSLAFLVAQQPELMQRSRMCRVAPQDLRIGRLGLVQPAGPMRIDGARPDIRIGGHRRAQNRWPKAVMSTTASPRSTV